MTTHTSRKNVFSLKRGVENICSRQSPGLPSPTFKKFHHYHYFYHSLLFVVRSVLFYPHQPLHAIIRRYVLIEALGLNNDSDSHSHGFGPIESDRHGNDP